MNTHSDYSKIFPPTYEKSSSIKESVVTRIIRFFFPEKKVIIFDLDWVISDDRERRYLAYEWRNENINWKKYFSTCSMDTPMHHLYPLLKAYKVIFFTGRSESTSVDTNRWIKKHFPWINYSIMFRPNDSRKPAEEVKEDMLLHISHMGISPNDIYFAVDDDHKVCAMYRNYWIKTLQPIFYVKGYKRTIER